MRARPARAAVALGVAVVIASAVGFVPALAPEPADAATAPGLTMVGATTYDVQPDVGRVAVTVQLAVTNQLKDTVTKRFFFRVGYITVLPGVSNLRITGGGAQPAVSVSSATDTYTNLKIDLGANLAGGKSTTLTLDFDVKDPGGAPDRAVRISRSLVSFAAWAFATPGTPGATVDVRFPEGYSVTVGRGPLDGPVPDGTGHEHWTSGVLATPLSFVADISADRPADYDQTERTVTMAAGSATVQLQAWPDDSAWRDRVGRLVERALPVLEREIGVPWPVDGPLAVHEALVRSTGGYAGLFAPADRRIEIAYSASDGTVLHELAHAWFNGGMVADRWAAEAFTSYYAEVAAKELGIEPVAPELPETPSPAAIPLNAWGPSGSEKPDTEAWAYAASLALARAIAERAGAEHMRAVWSKARAGIGAYQPDPASTEQASGPPDWRGLLDLLESETGGDFGDLWRAWVARPDDLAILADRAATRGYYLRSAALAGDWRLPPATRLAMRAWRFDVARELLLATDAVLAQRKALETAAAAAGATLPGTLKATFEGTAGLATAAAEAQAEQATLEAITQAEAARPTESGVGEQLIISVGLLFADPGRSLGAAQVAFTAGDLEGAYATAQAAQTTWAKAAEVGRARIVSTVLLLLAMVLLAGIVRGRGRARPEPTVSPEPRVSPEPPESPA
ncbi:MAG: hypothetical protein HYX55_05905 [Chloroflexi bacterium]|nr:hypothetical protein [Chloroflexota bacterium]